MNSRVGGTTARAGGTPSRLWEPLPPGDVLVLRVRRQRSTKGSSHLVLTAEVAESCYTEELIGAWGLVEPVVAEVRSGRRNMGGQR